jgi:undecaprenyl-diphosphatase
VLGVRLRCKFYHVKPRFEIAAVIVAVIALLCAIWLALEVTRGNTAAFDTETRTWLHASASPELTRLLEAATVLGSQAVVLAVAGCGALGLLFVGRRDRALLIVIAMAGGELLLSILKMQFHRARPEPFFGVQLPQSYTFPSGHALLSVCCYGMLATFIGRRWVWIAAALLILTIGFSRVYLGVHHASDVIAGHLVAIAWLAARV